MATENEHSPLKWGETLVYWPCKADIDLLGISIEAVHTQMLPQLNTCTVKSENWQHHNSLLMQRSYCSQIKLLESFSQFFHNLLNLKDINSNDKDNANDNSTDNGNGNCNDNKNISLVPFCLMGAYGVQNNKNNLWYSYYLSCYILSENWKLGYKSASVELDNWPLN